MPTLDYFTSKEIAKNQSSPIQLVEINRSGGAGLLYVSTQSIEIGGNTYDDLLVKLGNRTGGTFNIGEGIPSEHSFSFTLADPDGSLGKTPAATFLGNSVVLREGFIGIPLASFNVYNFIIRKVTQNKDKTLSVSCTDMFSIQDLPTLPNLKMTAAVFPYMENSLVDKTVPVLYGTKRFAITLVDAGEVGVRDYSRFLVAAGGCTINNLWQREKLLTELTDYNVVYLDASGNTIVSQAAAVYTCVDVLYKVLSGSTIPTPTIYDAGSSVTQFIVNATRANSLKLWGTKANTPTNVFADLYSDTNYGLSKSTSDLDNGTFSSSTTTLEAQPIEFNCLLTTETNFSSLFGNLLFSSHSWTRINDRIYYYFNPSTTHTQVVDDSIILLDNNNLPGITRQNRDLSRVFNKLTLEYEEQDFWGIETAANPGPQSTKVEANVTTGAGGSGSIGEHDQGNKKSLFLGDFNSATLVAQLNIQELANSIYDTSITVGLEGKAYNELDLVPVTWDDFGWDNQLVRITSISNNLHTYTLNGYTQETKSTIPGTQTNPTPATNAADQQPDPVTGLVGTFAYHKNIDGSLYISLNLDWNASNHPLVSEYLIQMTNLGNNEVQQFRVGKEKTTYTIGNYSQTALNLIEVFVLTSNNLRSTASSITPGVPNYPGSPTTPSNNNVEYSIDGIHIYWDDVLRGAFPDFDHFRLEKTDGTLIYSGNATTWKASYQALVTLGISARNDVLYLRTVDKWGNADTNTISIILSNNLPAAPTNLTATTLFTSVKLTSDPYTDTDIVRREFWFSTDGTNYEKFNDVAGSSSSNISVLFSGKENTQYYFKCIDVDFLSTVIGDEYTGNWSAIANAPTLGVTAPDLSDLGGVNLLRNAGFENATGTIVDGWSAFSGASNPTRSTDKKYGAYSMLVSAASTSTGGVSNILYTDTDLDASDVAGKKVTFSFYYKQPSTNPSSSIKFRFKEGATNHDSPLVPTTSWQRFSTTIDIPTTTTSGSLYIFPNTAASSTNYAVLIDGMQVQVGDTLTAWIPHYKDVLQGGTDMIAHLVDSIQIDQSSYLANGILQSSHIDPSTPFIDQHSYLANDVIIGNHISAGQIVSSHIAANTITASNLIQTENLLTNSIQVKDAIIKDSHISDVSADKLTAGSIDASVINISGGVGGSYWDGTGIHLGSEAVIDFNNVNSTPEVIPSSQLLAYWPFDNSNLIDYSGNGNDLSGTINYTPSVIGLGAERNGSSLTVSNPSGALDSALRTEDFFIAFWWTPRIEADWQDLFTFYDGTNTFRIEHGNDNVTNAGYWFGSTGSINHAAFMPYGTPVHVVASCSRTSNTLSVYINGVLDRTGTQITPVFGTLNFIRLFNDGALDTEILDDFRIYSGVPTQAQVSYLYSLTETSAYDPGANNITDTTQLTDGANLGGTADWGNVNSKPEIYRIVAKGNSATTAPRSSALIDENGAVLKAGARSYNVSIYDRATGTWDSHTTYDVYGNVADATNMANALNALGSDKIVIVFTYDEPHDNRTAGGLPAALYRCGASPAIFNSANFQWRSAYILVGIPGIGTGNGIELYSGDKISDPDAWVDTSIQIYNGNIQLGRINVRDAVDISYSNGTVVDNLRPAEANATVGAITGTNLRNSNNTILYDDDIVTGNAISSFSGLLPNWNINVADNDNKPAGIKAVESISDQTGIFFGDATNTFLKLSHATHADLAYGFPAIPIDDKQIYKVTVRHKSSAAGTGLYLRFNERNTALQTGTTHVGIIATPWVSARSSWVDLIGNGPYPGTTWVEDTYTYTPTAGTKVASFSMYRFGPTTTDYFVDYVQVTASGNYTPGADVTANNTANDTANVGGTASATVLSDIAAAANPGYIYSTYIDSIEVKSPQITGNLGTFTGKLTIGTMSTSSGITIDDNGIYHGNTIDHADSKFGIKVSGGAYFKGEVDSNGAYGRVRLNGGATYLFEIYNDLGDILVGTSTVSTHALIVNAGLSKGGGVRSYGLASNAIDASNSSSSNGTGRFTNSSTGHALEAYGSGVTYSALYSYNSTYGPAGDISNINATYNSGYSALEVKNRSGTISAMPPLSITSSGKYAHIRIGNSTIVNKADLSSITGKWGDVILIRESTTDNFPVLCVCLGNGIPGAPGSYGAHWRGFKNAWDI